MTSRVKEAQAASQAPLGRHLGPGRAAYLCLNTGAQLQTRVLRTHSQVQRKDVRLAAEVTPAELDR